ncbi:RcnB family protein [Ottowia thiooxydans]|uniref:Ni/Co efflux regulator RcnB n=1 Tax=Ottowia thiooxydans TaxID=219182 RepID=A0ABV2Q6N2_9BURK
MKSTTTKTLAGLLALCMVSAPVMAQPGRGDGRDHGRDGRNPGHQQGGPDRRGPPPSYNHRPGPPPHAGPHRPAPRPPGWVNRPGYNHPEYRRFNRGDRLPPEFRQRQYVVNDWRGHGLRPPPRGYYWVQNGSDYLLAAIATGIISAVVINAMMR